MGELSLKKRSSERANETTSATKAAGPLHGRLTQLAAALNGTGIVQRTVWEYGDSRWTAIDGAGGAAPQVASPADGMIYDDETGRLYADSAAYEDALRAAVFGAEDLPDEDASSDYSFEEDSEEEMEEEDEDSAADSTAASGNASAMDLEARRKIGIDALRRPVATSSLTAPSPRFKSRSMTSSDKFKVGGVMGQRTQQSGSVAITLQSVALWVNDRLETRERPIAVTGIVEPTATTGRGGAPDPLSGVQVYTGGGAQPKLSVRSERNSGIPDSERGHVMALELGGPDIPENIVPQWAKFQGSGEWRRMEVAVLAKAKALPKGQKLQYAVEIFYKDTGEVTPTLRSFGFPSGFRTTTRVVTGSGAGPETVEFHQGQAQDQTDQMLSERKLSEADEGDWDKALNIGKEKKPRAKAPKKREPPKSVKGAIDAAKKKKAEAKAQDTSRKRQQKLNQARFGH